jgi:aminocarboxymuconate-semialdehyde decarboxylase
VTVIDFHNHFYPPEYLEAVKSGPSKIRVTTDAAGNPVLHSPGDKNYVVPGHRDIEYRQRVLDEAGIDMQVLTLTTPGPVIEEPEFAVSLARTVNDALARIVAERPKRFTALATLPLNDPEASVVEAERAMTEHDFKGFMVFSNVNGVALADERFWPLYEKVNDAGAVMYIHPTFPVGVEAMTEYWLMPLVGFVFDTTLAAAALVFSGVVKRYPDIRWVLGHLGGAIPYLAERLDRGFKAYEACRVNIDMLPSEYLKKFYYDSVNFDANALALAIEFAGVDHILAGSDYPHLIGSLKQMVDSVQGLEQSSGNIAKILGGNTATLLGL